MGKKKKPPSSNACTKLLFAFNQEKPKPNFSNTIPQSAGSAGSQDCLTHPSVLPGALHIFHSKKFLCCCHCISTL